MQFRIFVVALAALPAVAGSIVTGPTGAGLVSQVTDTGLEIRSFNPYPGFTGGVRVATGDVNGDSIPDVITGAGAGGGPHVKVFDGRTGVELTSFFAFEPGFLGGIYVAAGDINGDGRDDVIVGAGDGATNVRAFSGVDNSLLSSFFAYSPSFTGGVRVAAGDVNGDGIADIITGAGPGGGPHVKAFSGSSGAALLNFFASDPGFTGGVHVASGDVNGDGKDDVVVAGSGSVSVFGSLDVSLLNTFAPYGSGYSGGVTVAAGDINGDGRADIVVGNASGGGGHVKVFDGATFAETESFLVASSREGVYVAVTPVPEPATIGIAGLGIGLLLLKRRLGAG